MFLQPSIDFFVIIPFEAFEDGYIPRLQFVATVRWECNQDNIIFSCHLNDAKITGVACMTISQKKCWLDTVLWLNAVQKMLKPLRE